MQKMSNSPFFKKFSWGSMPPDPLIKGHGFTIMWLYVQRDALTHANLTFRKKILTPYQILYRPTLLTYMYKGIQDIKYKF